MQSSIIENGRPARPIPSFILILALCLASLSCHKKEVTAAGTDGTEAAAPVNFKWGAYSVHVESRPEEFMGSTVTFTNSKTKKILKKQSDYSFFISSNIYTIQKNKTLFLVFHSGGESGGFTAIYTFVQAGGNIIESPPVEVSGYSRIDFTDIDGNGSVELITDDFSFENTEIGTYRTPLLCLAESREGLFPVIYTIENAHLACVTSSPQYRACLEEFAKKTERGLAGPDLYPLENPEDETRIITLLQYYSYLQQIGAQHRGENFLSQITIRLGDGRSEIALMNEIKKGNVRGILYTR